MVNKKFIVSLLSGLLLIGALLSPMMVYAEQEKKSFSSQKHAVHFEYSGSLVQIAESSPESVVSLVMEGRMYPRLDITISSEGYREMLSDEQRYRDEILKEYRAKGFGEVKHVRTYPSSVAGTRVITTELTYQVDKEPLIGSVTVVPYAEGKHLIIRYVDFAAKFYRHKLLREEVVQSLRFGNNSVRTANVVADSALEHSDKAFKWLRLLGMLLLVVLLAGGIIKYRTTR